MIALTSGQFLVARLLGRGRKSSKHIVGGSPAHADDE